MTTPTIQDAKAHAVLLQAGRAICATETLLVLAMEAGNEGMQDEIEGVLKNLRHVAGYAVAVAMEDKEAA